MYGNGLISLFLLVAAGCVAAILGLSLVLLLRGRLDARGRRLACNLLAGSILAVLAILAWFGFLDGTHHHFFWPGRRMMGR